MTHAVAVSSNASTTEIQSFMFTPGAFLVFIAGRPRPAGHFKLLNYQCTHASLSSCAADDRKRDTTNGTHYGLRPESGRDEKKRPCCAVIPGTFGGIQAAKTTPALKRALGGRYFYSRTAQSLLMSYPSTIQETRRFGSLNAIRQSLPPADGQAHRRATRRLAAYSVRFSPSLAPTIGSARLSDIAPCMHRDFR